MSESNIMKRIMLAASRAGMRLFRNNCGVAKFPNGTAVRYGIANPGGSDLIGWTTRVYNGKRVAVFTAIEVKTDTGRPSEEQLRFLDAVRMAGGIAILARSEADLPND